MPRPLSEVPPIVSTPGSFIGEPGPPGSGGSDFTAAGDLSGTSTSQTVVGIQNQPVAATAPALNEVLAWDGAQWEPATGGGGGFTASGDLTGDGTRQIVSAIRGIESPESTVDTNVNNTIILEEDNGIPFITPRSVVTDGTYLYIAESGQGTPPGSAIVRKMTIPGGRVLGINNQIDLSTILGTIDRVRDLAIDDNYIYAACWSADNVAIIDKATMTVVGWGWAGAGSNVTSVCADNAGNFYCHDSYGPGIYKFTIASCLGQPPNTVTFVDSYDPSPNGGRWIRYYNGHIWFTDGANGAGVQKIDPATMTLVVSNLTNATMSSLYAFGSLWVSSEHGINNYIYRYNATTLAVDASIILPTVPSDSYPNELTLGPDSSGTPDARIFVSDLRRGRVYVIDPSTNTLEATLTLEVTGLAGLDGIVTVNNITYVMGFDSVSAPSLIGIYYIDYPNNIWGEMSVLKFVYSPGLANLDNISDGWYPIVRENLPEPNLISPRQVISDGTYLYVAESSDSAPWGSSIVRKFMPSVDGKKLTLISSIDVAQASGLFTSGVGSVGNSVRDLAQDSLYLYASCGQNYWGTVTTLADNIAIIDKATMTIAGWGWMGAGRRAGSVCADGAGNFYCNYTVYVSKFNTAACLGAAPNTVSPTATYTGLSGKWIRYGGGNIYFVDGQASTFGIRRIVAASMTLGTSNATNTPLRFVLSAFGSVWATGTTNLYRMDATTLAVSATIPITGSVTLSYIWTGPDSSGTPDARLYVASMLTPRIYVINPGTNTVEATLTLDSIGLEGMAVVRDILYAMSFDSTASTEISPAVGIHYVDYPGSSTGRTHFEKSFAYLPSPSTRHITGLIGDFYDRQATGNSYESAVRTIPMVADSQTITDTIVTDPYSGVENGLQSDGPFIWIARSGSIVKYATSALKIANYIPLSSNGTTSSATHIVVTPRYIFALTGLSTITKIDRVTAKLYDPIGIPYSGEGLVFDEENNRLLTLVANASYPGIIMSIDIDTHEINQYSLPAITETARGLIKVDDRIFYFGTANFWRINVYLNTFTISGVATAIPSPNGQRVRSIYAAGYIFFVSVGGTVLGRIVPSSSATSSISVTSGTYDLTYEPETPSVWITRNSIGFQQVTSPTGVMALGTATARTDTLRAICWDPYARYMFFGSLKTATPRNAQLSYITKTGAISDLGYFNQMMDWTTYNDFQKYVAVGSNGATVALSEYNKLVMLRADPAIAWAYTLNLPANPTLGTRILMTDATAGLGYAALTVTIQADVGDRLMGTLGGSTTITNNGTKEFIWTIFGSTRNWIWY